MDKRGQIYILAAIIFAIIIYGLSTVVNVVQQEEIKSDFESLSKNYETESSKLINSVLQSGGNVTEAFANFTFLFTSYSKSKSPSFHIFYALAYEKGFHVGNFMDEEIIIYVPCPTLGGQCPQVGDPSRHVLLGCLSDISAQMSFEGLTIKAEYLADEFKDLREKCTPSIGEGLDYCVVIGGIMYKLPVEENVPKMFSLSRLKSGEQALYSARGEIGEEQFCLEFTNACDCDGTGTGCGVGEGCPDVCCWDAENNICLEGRC